MKFIYLVFFFVILFAASCDKRTDGNRFQDGIYESETIVTQSNPVLYTTSGLITDRNIINKHINRLKSLFPSTKLDSLFKFDVPMTPLVYTLRLRIADKKGYFYRPRWRDPEGYQEYELNWSSLGDGEMLGTYKDSTTGMIFQGLGYRCWLLSELVNKYNPVYDTIGFVPWGNGSGGDYITQYLPLVPIRVESKNVIVIPTFIYSVSFGSCMSSSNIVLNQLNPELTNKLEQGDTVLIRERHIRLLKK